MNKKFYVPFETAQALKEKGYPQSDAEFYYSMFESIASGDIHERAKLEALYKERFSIMIKYLVASPTYHEVLDWLQEKGHPIESACVREYSDSDLNWICGIGHTSTKVYSTREEALNAGILKALEML